MVNVALWQLVVFVISGVAVGAIVTMLVAARMKQEPAPSARLPMVAVAESAPASVIAEPVRADRVAAALNAAETRQEKVKEFLKRRLANQRNVTVDEAAKCLSVSPRRIRKLLENGTLVAIPLSGGRMVSSVSMLDLVMRQENAVVKRAEPVTVAAEPAREPDEPPGTVKPPPPTEPTTAKHLSVEGLEPGPNQLYWYFVAGYDKPCRSIREALAAQGLAFQYTDWRSIPASIRKKIQRERVVH